MRYKKCSNQQAEDIQLSRSTRSPRRKSERCRGCRTGQRPQGASDRGHGGKQIRTRLADSTAHARRKERKNEVERGRAKPKPTLLCKLRGRPRLKAGLLRSAFRWHGSSSHGLLTTRLISPGDCALLSYDGLHIYVRILAQGIFSLAHWRLVGELEEMDGTARIATTGV